MKSIFSMKSVLLLLFFALSFSIQSAPKLKPMLERVEPSFWWVGFKNHDLQLLVH